MNRVSLLVILMALLWGLSTLTGMAILDIAWLYAYILFSVAATLLPYTLMLGGMGLAVWLIAGIVARSERG